MDSSLSESRTQATHDAVLARAMAAFVEDGFQNADVQAIAADAGAGYGSIYHCFRSKEELFWAAACEIRKRLEARMRESIRECPRALDALRAAGLDFAGFFAARPEYLAVFAASRAEFHGRVPPSHQEFHEELIHLFVKVIEQGVADGEIRPLDARSTVIALGSMLYGLAMFDCYVEGQGSLSQRAAHALDIFLRGIGAERCTEAVMS